MKWLVIGAAAATVFGLVPLLGLPGAILLAAGEPVCRLIYGAAYAEASEKAGAGIWSIAILITVVWPWALPPVWYAVDKTKPLLRRSLRLLIAAGCLAAWTILLDTGAAGLIMHAR